MLYDSRPVQTLFKKYTIFGKNPTVDYQYFMKKCKNAKMQATENQQLKGGNFGVFT